jgi:HD-GYP domain-containing protein (c-di-GMP phosphodiesterase class II)
MVRLSDALQPGEGKKPQSDGESAAAGSLPEVLILTERNDFLDQVRRAVEDRGYRLHHALTTEEVRTRLKAVGRVFLVVDAVVEGAIDLLHEDEVAERPFLVVSPVGGTAGMSFGDIPGELVLSEPLDAHQLLERVTAASKQEKPRERQRRIFSMPPAQKGVPVQLSKEGTDLEMPAEPTEPTEPEDQEAVGTEPVMLESPEPVPDAPESPVEDEPPVPPATDVASTADEIESGPPPERTVPDSGPEEMEIAEAKVLPDGRIVSKAYVQSALAVTDFMKGHRAQTNPPLNQVALSVEALIEDVKSTHELFLAVIHHVPEFDDVDVYLAHHQINVAILATTIGLGLEYDDQQLFELALSATVHDVGMTQLPEGLVGRRGKLDQSGYSQIKQHPGYGREALRAYASAYPFLPDVAYQEHERLDGSGYPEGLEGEAIHPYARAVGLADTYEALTHSRPFRKRMIPFNVLQQLIRLGGRLFHSDLVKTLIEEISVFPLGSYVRLNTGEAGKVVATNRGYPLRPAVEIQFAADGATLERNRSIDLKEEPMLYITGPVDMKEIKKD